MILSYSQCEVRLKVYYSRGPSEIIWHRRPITEQEQLKPDPPTPTPRRFLPDKASMSASWKPRERADHAAPSDPPVPPTGRVTLLFLCCKVLTAFTFNSSPAISFSLMKKKISSFKLWASKYSMTLPRSNCNSLSIT